MLKKTLKVLCVLIVAVLVCAVVLIAWLSVTEYKPKAVEKAEIYDSEATGLLDKNESIKILSFNTGYAGLGEEADFFMDGGKNIRTGDKDTVLKNLAGISGIIENSDADICLLQEVDSDSMRTFGIDEREYYLSGSEKYAAFALNYSCAFVPYPLPPIGKVNSGLMTVSDYKISDSERISLPCPFSWPIRVANLKRCLLASYCDIEGTDEKLVIVNLHLEAYDDGEGKAAQTKMLKEFLQAEYEKGNYVIAGGDFNQYFPGFTDKYPIKDPSLWVPGILENDVLPDGWSFVFDDSVPSCRLNNQPYDPESEATQHYLIDGFIISPNVELLSVATIDEGFRYSDHNPVAIEIALK